VIRRDGSNTPFSVSETAEGAFTKISAMASAENGRVYKSGYVHLVDAVGNFSAFPLSDMQQHEALGMETMDTCMYITNPLEDRIYKYSSSGIPDMSGPLYVSFTANGVFKPVRIFAHFGNFYIVNLLNKKELLCLNADLSLSGT